MYTPRVEGVHLRMGYVARGGLRWSDRREDFRTEVLGLMKAQNVKNTVIVPVGAKGGFYPKRLPRGRSARTCSARASSATRPSSAACSTSPTTSCDGKIVPPRGVVRRDGDDPYLVVAADKGTATFSDIANAHLRRVRLLARRRVRLRRLGRLRPQGHGHHRPRRLGMREAPLPRARASTSSRRTSPCAGIGDMSGDVFGNGMLLSKHIRLVAAFDHRHIFIDPEPDAAAQLPRARAPVRAAALQLGRLRRAS